MANGVVGMEVLKTVSGLELLQGKILAHATTSCMIFPV